MEIELKFKEKYDLIHTFECGQIFRFETFDYGKTYYGPLKNHIIKISQKDIHTLVIQSNSDSNIDISEFRRDVNQFFRISDNYFEMQKSIAIDDLMRKIVSVTDGLHVLKQDKFECMVAYILSQCSNIPRIKSNLYKLASKYGKLIIMDKHEFYTFPTRNDLLNVTEETYREMGFGYRAKYLANFISNYPKFLEESNFNKSLDKNEPNRSSQSEEFNKKLKTIEGIGQKVADCIQLFAYGDLSLYPVDTWMKKFMIKYYTHGNKTNERELRTMGRKMFGKWAGYAQEFIFRYARCYDIDL